MSTRQSRESRQPEQPPDIISLRPAVDGVHLSLRCRACGHAFERYQPTLAGVAIGRHPCPRCQAVCLVWPEDFEAAMDRCLPRRALEEMVRLTETANQIAESWYRIEPLAALLTYRGVNLGEPTERELLSFFTLAVQEAERLERRT